MANLKHIAIEVEEEFRTRVKIKAAENKLTIREVIVNLLNKWLEENDKSRS